MDKTDIILIRNANQYDFGGAEKYQLILAQQLLAFDFHPMIISGHSSILQTAIENNLPHQTAPWLKWQNFSGWRIILLPIYILWQVRLFFFYKHLFQKIQAPVVVLQSRDDFIAGTLAAHALNMRIIWTDHADLKHLFQNINHRYKNPIGKFILKLSRLTHQIILVSNSEKQVIATHIPAQHDFWRKISVVHNGSLDTTQPHQSQSDFIFGMVCRLVQDKGLEEAITAFHAIHQHHPRSQLWIIGDGPEAHNFHEVADSHPSIKFLSYQSQPLNFVAQFNCFLQPTYHEALSLSLVEACMMSLPIITTDVGGNPEVITNNYNGLLIPPCNSQALAEAMTKIITDSKLAQKLATNARRTFEKKFDFTKIVQQQLIPIYFPNHDKIKSCTK